MVDLQDKWIELDEILGTIKGTNTEMKEKQEVSNFLKSLGMKRVLPSVVQTRLSDRRVARIYVWKNSPIGNVGLLTGRSIDPSLHYLILESENLANDESDLEVKVSGKTFISVPIPISLPSQKRQNTRSKRVTQVKRTNSVKQHHKPVKRHSTPLKQRKIKPNPSPTQYDGSVPSPYETSAFDKFFPDTVVVQGGKLGNLATAVLFASPYLTKKGYNLAIVYDLSDDGSVFDVTIQLRTSSDQTPVVSLPFTIDGDDTADWNTTWSAISGELIPFASAEFEKYLDNPSAYIFPTAKSIKELKVPIVKYVHKDTGEIETKVSLDDIYQYTIYDGSQTIKQITEPEPVQVKSDNDFDLDSSSSQVDTLNSLSEPLERELANEIITEKTLNEEVDVIREALDEPIPQQDKSEKVRVKYTFEGVQEEPIIPITDDLLFTVQDFADVKANTAINYKNLWWIFAKNMTLKPLCDRLKKLFVPKNSMTWCQSTFTKQLSAGKQTKTEMIFGLSDPNSSSTNFPFAFGITSQSNGLRLRVGKLTNEKNGLNSFTPQKAYRLTMPYKQFKGMPLKEVMVGFFNMVLIHILSNPNILAKIGEYCQLPTEDTFTGVIKTIVEPSPENLTYSDVLKDSDIVKKLLNVGYEIVDETLVNTTIDEPLYNKTLSIQLNLPQPNTLVAKNIIFIIFKRKTGTDYMVASVQSKNPELKEGIIAGQKSFSGKDFIGLLQLFEDVLEDAGVLQDAVTQAIDEPVVEPTTQSVRDTLSTVLPQITIIDTLADDQQNLTPSLDTLYVGDLAYSFAIAKDDLLLLFNDAGDFIEIALTTKTKAHSIGALDSGMVFAYLGDRNFYEWFGIIQILFLNAFDCDKEDPLTSDSTYSSPIAVWNINKDTLKCKTRDSLPPEPTIEPPTPVSEVKYEAPKEGSVWRAKKEEFQLTPSSDLIIVGNKGIFSSTKEEYVEAYAYEDGAKKGFFYEPIPLDEFYNNFEPIEKQDATEPELPPTKSEPISSTPQTSPTTIETWTMLSNFPDGTLFVSQNQNNALGSSVIAKIDDEIYAFNELGDGFLEEYDEATFNNAGGSFVKSIEYDPLRVEEAYLDQDTAQQLVSDALFGVFPVKGTINGQGV